MIKITWLGHAAFKIEIQDLTILVDPWIKRNPVSPLKNYKDISKADLVLVTHDHGDHGFKDAIKICKRNKSTFAGVYELANKARRKLVKRTVGGNIGGEIEFEGIKVFFAPAWHSSKIAAPCGFVVKTKDITFYHTGDTGYYSDMGYLGEKYNIDMMMLPICSPYMMGIDDAIRAISKVGPEVVVPMHYNTFPGLNADVEEFKRKVGQLAKVEVLRIGEDFLFKKIM
jgi:L-ascorbate metabolism protein UlaG (beta-lactamase superfamily)